MADDKDRISKESLKAVEDFVKQTEKGKQNAQAINDVFGNIATQLFGISGAAFFKQVPKTVEELEAGRKKVSAIKNELDKSFKDVGASLGKQFEDALGTLESGVSKFNKEPFLDSFKQDALALGFEFENLGKLQEDIKGKFGEHSKEFNEFKKKNEDFVKEQENHHKSNEDFYKQVLADNTELFAGLSDQERLQKLQQVHQAGFNNLVSEGSDLIKDMAMYSDGVDASIKQAALDANGLKDRLAQASQEAEETSKSTFSMGEGFKKMGKNFAADIIPKMLEYDQAVSDAGKNFGFVGMKSAETSKNMAVLGQSAARFNVSMGDAVNMMGALGEELQTIDQDYLANSVEHFMAIEKATGISSAEITTIAGEMMRAGKSAEEVEQYMEGSNKMAKLFGVNTKKVLQGVARNIDKMRQMGFQGGEASLTRMVATAERLRMNVDEIFDMSKKARNIEGAMDMAAELQLAGGSFANIDPMSLLAAARKGPEEMQKILTQMGGDIGNFNKETGELEFDAIDADRLQMMADATGTSVDSMQKMLQKQAQDNQKMNFMPDMQLEEVMGPDGKPLDQDMMNNMLLDAVDVNGKALEGGMLDEMGIASLEDLTAEQAQDMITKKMNDQATLAEQAEQNQSFQESIDAFKAAIMNLFVVFEPVLKVLTSMIQTLNGMPGPIKALVAGLVGFAMIAPKLGQAMDGMKKGFSMMKGVIGKAKGFLGKGAEAAGGQDKLAGKISDTAKSGGAADSAKGSGGGLKSLAEGLKAMGDKDVFKGILAVALAGPALLLMLPGMPTVLLMGLVGMMGPTVELGFKSLANGIAAMGKAKGIWKGLAVMALIGIALIPFAFAAHMMVGVDWLSVLAGIGILALITLGLIAMGVMMTGPQLLFMLYAVGILILIGVALLVFGLAMQQFALGSAMMQEMDFSFLASLGLNLMLAAPGLILGGLALMMAAPALLIGSFGLLAIGLAVQTLSGVDWDAFSQIGSALLSIVPGLLGFSLAGLMFVNPITLLGMLLMIGNLGMLAAVMIPLSESLLNGADGLDRFTDGLVKLQAAANSLDLEKLESLKSLSFSMALAGLGGGILGDQIDKIAEALTKLTNAGSGGGKGGGAQKIQIDLKLNGRDLQSIIVDDTEIVS